jgi:N-methylhydantoinase A
MTHGSTVATNALLERKGARIALVTTAGFEDVLAIGRQNRPSLYDFNPEKPPPLVARSDIFGVAERTFHDGKIEIELDKQEVERIAETIIAGKYDSVAICFLHSYANPENETRAADIIEKTGVPVSVSHRVLPQYREYERFGTTSINAYVSPVMATYLEALEEKIPKHARLRVMQSNGGSISSARARQEAVRTILSGPAAGVVGAFEVARRAGFDRIITFDMGGTSTDVSLCDGKISIRTSSTISGCPVGVPVVDIHTVGAGGGSISWLDEAGSLRVGPKSAGADPGPVCYGRGSEITVTDANLLLGRMSAEHFLGGAMPLDFDRAERHMLKFANDLGLSVGDAAEGVLKVANAVMERAVRVISVERGHDPRRFALVAFGGAGPMHACDLARSLSIPNIIIPNNAGVLSALGLVLADVSKDFSRTVLLQVEDVSPEKLDSLFAPLEKQAAATLASEGFTPERIRLDRQLDMRYVGQSYEVTVAAGPDFLNAFHAEHFRLYGHSSASRPAELVNIRLAAVGATDKPELARAEVSDDKVSGSGDAVLERKLSIFEGASFETPIHDRTALGPGDLICGPAIIVELSATTVVAPDFEARVDAFGNLIMKSTAG